MSRPRAEAKPYDEEAGRLRAREVLAELDRVHAATLPACALCGQRALRLDEWGLCSKESQPHLDYRASHPRRRTTAP